MITVNLLPGKNFALDAGVKLKNYSCVQTYKL